ncbi:hypothetical protein VP01_5622g1, partial [Puccinia sorghi]
HDNNHASAEAISGQTLETCHTIHRINAQVPCILDFAGFASHSATKFCSWCHVLKDEMGHLKLGQPRSGAEVQQTTQNWLGLKTLTSRENIVQQNVHHVALSMMHNWMEGVLMHQLRERWGAHPSPKQARLENLAEEERDKEDTSSDSDSDDFELNQGATGGLFETTKTDYLRGALANMVLPTVVVCIPSQLGKSHCGKLKASKWYVLFVYVIPLIVSEIFVDHIKNVRVHSNLWWIMENMKLLI